MGQDPCRRHQAPLKPLELQAYDKRFGVRIPYRGDLLDGIDEFPIELPHVGPCSFTIRSGAARPAALFLCEAFAPLPVPGGPLLVIKHPTLNILFNDAEFQIESVGNFEVDRQTLDNWLVLLRGLSYLADGTASIEFEFGGIRVPALPAPERALNGPYRDELPRLLEFVERWEQALHRAGVASEIEFSMEDIFAARTAQMSLDIIFNPEPVARFEFDEIGGLVEGDRVLALYFNTCRFAGAAISFATTVTLERHSPSSAAFSSTAFDLLDIRPAVVDIDEYGAEIARRRNIHVVIDPDTVIVETRAS